MHCTATERAQLFKGLQRWSAAAADRLAYVGLVASLVHAGEPRPLAGCHFTEESIVIGADGAVSPCFVKQAVVFGNIRVDSPAIIQERRREFLRTAHPGSCVRSDCLGVL
jgi:MoaA/NifB/PqqE/SkfB family radical SAM enzyme